MSQAEKKLRIVLLGIRSGNKCCGNFSKLINNVRTFQCLVLFWEYVDTSSNYTYILHNSNMM